MSFLSQYSVCWRRFVKWNPQLLEKPKTCLGCWNAPNFWNFKNKQNLSVTPTASEISSIESNEFVHISIHSFEYRFGFDAFMIFVRLFIESVLNFKSIFIWWANETYRLCRFSINFSSVTSSNRTKSWTPTSICCAIFDVCEWFSLFLFLSSIKSDTFVSLRWLENLFLFSTFML